MSEEEKQAENKPLRDEQGRLLPGQCGNPHGHPLGQPNYKTRFKKLLEKWAAMKAPEKVISKIRDDFKIEDLPEGASFEEVESLRVHLAAISGESWAYDRLHDKPCQGVDITTKGKQIGNRTDAELEQELADLRRRRKNLRGGRAEADLPA